MSRPSRGLAVAVVLAALALAGCGSSPVRKAQHDVDRARNTATAANEKIAADQARLDAIAAGQDPSTP